MIKKGRMKRSIYSQASEDFRTLIIPKFGTVDLPKWPIDPRDLFELRQTITAICNKYDCQSTWKDSNVSESSHVDSNVILGENAQVYHGSVIFGPCIIGANTRIGPSAFVHDQCWIGENAVVGHSCEVKKSILLDGVKVFHFGFIGDSIISYNTNIGAGTIFAVKRLDGQNVRLKLHNAKEYVSNRKYGAIVGKGVQFGINSLIMPGSIIEPGVKVYPGTIYGANNEN